MAALADLPPDRRAVLQLLVGRGRGYDEIAELLTLPEIVVRRRAHDAITALAGGDNGLSTRRRALVCDYLVGELPASRRAEARKLLAEDPVARRFARTAAARLSAIEGASLPELPDDGEEVAEALDALDARRERKAELESSSRVGGWLLIGGIAVAVVAVVVLLAIFAGGDDGGSGGNTDASGNTPAQSDGASANLANALVADLRSPSGGTATGQAGLRPHAGTATDFAVEAKGLQPTRKLEGGSFTAYTVWLVGPKVEPLRLGFYGDGSKDGVAAADGTLELQAKLNGDGVPAVDSKDLDKYDTVILSRETLKSVYDRPDAPTNVVLSGRLSSLQ